MLYNSFLLVSNKMNKLWSPLGAFQQLNAEEIENEVQEMFRTMHKLTKSFQDQPVSPSFQSRYSTFT